MGLFQFDEGSGLHPRYEITAPVFDKITILLSPEYYGGNVVALIANTQSEKNIYIQSVKGNGEPINTSWLPHEELVQGGRLELNLGPTPNKEWGTGEEMKDLKTTP